MYSIEELSFSIERISKLRHLLENLDPDKYDHSMFAFCGTPSCALGWATTIFDEIYIFDGYYVNHRNIVEHAGSIESGKLCFNINRRIAEYLFDFNVYYNGKESLHRDDDSIFTTLKRIRLIEDWFRRRLAILEVENENRTKKMSKLRKITNSRSNRRAISQV